MLSLKSAVKLYQAYTGALEACRSEQRHVDNARQKLDKLRAAKAEEIITEQKINSEQKSEEKIKSEQKSEQNIKDFPGSLVAVLVHLEETQNDEWLLATLLSFDPIQHLYTVEDVEAPEESGAGASPLRRQTVLISKRTFQVRPERLVRLAPDDQTALDGPAGEIKLRQSVLALFPGTTCFYPAIVVSTPSRRKRTRDYLVRFQGDDVPSRQCPPRFIIPSQKY